MVLNRRSFGKISISAGAFLFLNPLFSYPINNEEKIKGVYVPGWNAVSKKGINNFLELNESFGINTFMIDVKNAHGHLFYSPRNELAKEIGSQVKTREGKVRELNFEYLFNQANKRNFKIIARHVMFRDHLLYDKVPEFRLWSNKIQKWPDLRDEEVIDYNLNLLREESELGFDEIVLDYIRFPAVNKFEKESERCEIINGIVKKIRKNLNPEIDLGVQTFGYSSWDHRKSGVGQKIETLEKYVNKIYPMLYPSHFWKGSFGFANPSEHPYEFIKMGYKETMKKISKGTKVIPMIQAFNYSYNEFIKQLKAVRDCDMPGYVCWNPNGNYKFLNFPENQQP